MKEAARSIHVLDLPETARFPHSLRGYIRFASWGTIWFAIGAVAIAWIPVAVLSAIRGFEALKSFLLDYAAQTRMLVVIPLLILAEPPLVARLRAIGDHFLDEGLVSDKDVTRFKARLALLKQRNSPWVWVVIVCLIYGFTAYALSTDEANALMPWCYGPDGFSVFSRPGSWYVLISLPIVLILVGHWLWQQFVWFRFLGTVAGMDLQLIPSHPDRSAGLGFVQSCIRGYFPFAFAIGTIVAGGVANHVVYLHQRLEVFQYLPLVVIGIVVSVCVSPLCLFLGTLLRTKQRGIFQYGVLAITLGQEFEKKWLAAGAVQEGTLQVPDFSATTDLYSIAANVYAMNPLPLGMRTISRLIVAALAPALPLAFVVLPFDVILHDVMKLFF